MCITVSLYQPGTQTKEQVRVVRKSNLFLTHGDPWLQQSEVLRAFASVALCQVPAIRGVLIVACYPKLATQWQQAAIDPPQVAGMIGQKGKPPATVCSLFASLQQNSAGIVSRGVGPCSTQVAHRSSMLFGTDAPRFVYAAWANKRKLAGGRLPCWGRTSSRRDFLCSFNLIHFIPS
jgi:hypothetical protein